MSTGKPREFCYQDGRINTGNNFLGDDTDVEGLIWNNTVDTFDSCFIEFEFQCNGQASEIHFDYVFGSDEYTEYVMDNFYDTFAFFLNGNNIATVSENGTDAVNVKTINDQNNANLWVDNEDVDNPAYPLIEADGFTAKLTADGGNLIDGVSVLLAVSFVHLA